MIEFDCPKCGKHFQFSDKFAGRKMKCVGCGGDLLVPNSTGSVVTDNVVADVHDVTSDSTPVDAGLDFLVHVYQDTKLNADEAEQQQKTIVLPSVIVEPEPQAASSFGRWIFVAVLLLLAGGGFVAWQVLNTSPPDPRVAEIERLVKDSETRLIDAHNEEEKRMLLTSESQKLWLEANKSLDAVIASTADVSQKKLKYEEIQKLVGGGNDAALQQQLKISQEAAAMAESRYNGHLTTFNESSKKAAQNLVEADKVTVRWRELRTESDDLLAKADELRKSLPPEVDLPESVTSSTRHTAKEYKLRSENVANVVGDWTEGYFADYTFPESEGQNFFAAFDCGERKRNVGEFALRVTEIGEKPICVRLDAPKNAAWSIAANGCLGMLLRFPDVEELFDTVLLTEHTGKIVHINVRIGNEAGNVQYDAVSTRMLEAVFYGGRGKFQAIEIPLQGDNYWTRTHKLDVAVLDKIVPIVDDSNKDKNAGNNTTNNGNNVDPAPKQDNETRFFSRIEWIELRFVPASPITTVWIDELSFQPRKRHGNFDLVTMENYQEKDRRRDRDLIAERNREYLKRQMTAVSNAGSSTAAGGDGSLQSFAGESARERALRTAAWVLANGGQVSAVINGKTLEFESGQKIGDGFETLLSIDLADCKSVGDAELDVIGSIATLKRLNLARTGLIDDSLIKLSTLKQIEWLDLSGNKLTFDSLPHLTTLSGTLQTLRLNDFKWGQRGLEPLKKFVNLRNLSLSRSVVSDTDSGAFIMLGKLESLTINNTNASDKVLEILGTLTTLRSLDLRETRVTNNGVKALQKKLPELNVVK
ncbi:MAG: hypothetical protein LBU65_13855 [Planctomycetaceae bacterium]|jgi:hypothetical protein|nr:hypothetical protein [Planctomycetaceae bacterium]